MKRKIIIGTVASFLVSGVLLGPADGVSQVFYGIMGAILCAIPLLILSRCEFIKSSSRQVHTLVCVLVCMISVLAVTCQVRWRRIGDLYQQMTMLETPESETAQGGE